MGKHRIKAVTGTVTKQIPGSSIPVELGGEKEYFVKCSCEQSYLTPIFFNHLSKNGSDFIFRPQRNCPQSY